MSARPARARDSSADPDPASSPDTDPVPGRWQQRWASACAAAQALADELAELCVPRICVGCGADTVSVCARCLPALATDIVAAQPRYGTAVVTAAGPYTGVLRAALVAFKESGRRDLRPLLGLHLSRAVTACLQASPQMLSGHGTILLVPVPTTPKARRTRGGNHVELLGQSAAAVLRDEGLDIACAELLTVRRHRDQVGRGARGRRRNVRGTHALDTRFTPRARRALARTRIVLIDDICTTGATLAEAARALSTGGILPSGTAVIGMAPAGGRLTAQDDI